MYKQTIKEKWTKFSIFCKKGDLGISITLEVIAAKAYYATLFPHIRSEVRKNLFEKSEGLSEKSIHNFTDSDKPSNHRKSTSKKSPGDISSKHLITYSEGIRNKYYLYMIFSYKLLSL